MNLLQTLTLGTHRQPPTQEVTDYLTLRDAIDPTADDAEKALAAYALTERLERLRINRTEAPKQQSPIAEDWPPAPPKLGRALKLVFEETYAAILPEAVRVLARRELLFPPHLLPGLLDYAERIQRPEPNLSKLALAVGGNRATWLAGLNPSWQSLTEDYDHAAEWAKAVAPAQLAEVLERWRATDPEAAREALVEWWPKQSPKNQVTLLGALAADLAPQDLPWLRTQLSPKRKGVRRAILKLLLLGDEEEVTNDMVTLAAASLSPTGGFANTLQDDAAKEILNQYGGLQSRETLGEFLLGNLPPTLIPDLLGLAPEEFWPNLSKVELRETANALLFYGAPAPQAAFVTYALAAPRDRLPLLQLNKIVAALPQNTFVDLFHAFMDREPDGFRDGGIALQLAVQRRESWSERITRAYVRALVGKIRDSRGITYGASREQSELWKRAVPLLHINTFAFLREQLHAITERPDVFGKIALSMLQTTAFRRVLYDAPRNP
ncbi:DUF5691 domain-containing protein [Lewinella sp. 4G2]|uniref:DUF5691 domain-containing protein n=1 Tax=Lewinella sp. 4G2 TaxID=1803372 RepID=UPI0007B4DE63|nr:DUF5691 domain-containing protein [Lewinella sp. 4G2]OAV43951.1 hypothetical protein A3850_005340 [Lewinella sp. 4G2]